VRCRRANYKENPHRARQRAREYYAENRQVVLAREKDRRRDDVEKQLWFAARYRSRKLSLAFTITPLDVVVPKFCPALGIPLQVSDNTAGPNSPTIDRIIPSLGYTPDNIVVVSQKANTIKSNATIQEILSVVAFYTRVIEDQRDEARAQAQALTA